MKLLNVDSVSGAKDKLSHYFADLSLDHEEIDTCASLGRVAAADIISPVPLPEFQRATVDGYALHAKDTFGVSDSLPVFLELIGKVEMGEVTQLTVSSGQAVYVPTGGMIPKGADAMVMLEYVEQMDTGTIAVHRPSAPGENVIMRGEDLKEGTCIIKKGRRIKPSDIGALAGAGIARIKVFEKIRVAVISTGDEIVDPFGPVPLGKIRDINTYALANMVTEAGGIVTFKGVLADDFQGLKDQLLSLLPDNHILIISGGSSVGQKDVTAQVIDSLGPPGVFVHGVAVKPGKPTIIGRAGDTALFGLPGHPVSAIIIFKIFIETLMNQMTCHKGRENISLMAIADANIHAAPGKETYQPVLIEKEDGHNLAKLIHGKSGAISLMTRADGYVRIEQNKEGIKKGEIVQVTLL